VSDFDLPGVLRRIRRAADLSQRELARALDVSKSYVGGAESGISGLDVRVLARAAALAGLRLAVVENDGTDVVPMSGDAVRDRGNRRFPAHLDTRYSEEDWWHGPHRYAREQPWYTFDRDRERRDAYRRRDGIPADHQFPQPRDAPQERAADRRRRYFHEQAEERERRFLAGELCGGPELFTCDCPPACDELDDRSGRPVHAAHCPCSCDVC
jgi:HTH-type transcriptional regulator/antitoxin HipB